VRVASRQGLGYIDAMILTPRLMGTCLLFSVLWSPAQEPVDGAPPRLVVMVSVDQMIPEQLERLGPHFEGGFDRFLTEGRSFRRAALGHSRSETGPGHVTLATGVHPNRHGIVGNDMYDREAQASTYCVTDADAGIIGMDGPLASPGRSPKNVRSLTIGDRVQASYPDAKLVSLSMKDRSAIGMGGQHPTAAFWWDRVGGGFVSSTWYGEALPDWVRQWNAGWRAKTSGHVWTQLFEGGPQGSGTAPDDRPGEGKVGIEADNSFPHTPGEMSAEATVEEIKMAANFVYFSPLGDEYVLQLATEAVKTFDLGGDEVPDVLTIGLSTCDAVGHLFGPYSCEVTDLLLRTDRKLGELFALLDERVGKDQWIAVLSADHGVLPLPEHLQSQGVASERIPAGLLSQVASMVDKGLTEQFGSGFKVVPRPGGLALDVAAVAGAGLDIKDVRKVAREIVVGVEWVDRAYTFDELLDAEAEKGPRELLASRSVAPGRGPDIAIELGPWLLLSKYATGTSHGSAHPYDRKVPFSFLGPSVTAGDDYRAGVHTVDAVPTLLHQLGIEAAGLDGQTLPLE